MLNRNEPPVPELKINFDTPEIDTFLLPNGIEVFFVRKEKLPIVYTNIFCDAGSKFDIPELKGTAYLTSLLIDEGAGKLNALEISDAFEKLGSIFNVSADHDSACFSLLSLSENFKSSFDIVSQILLEPLFGEQHFNREKKKVIDRILQLKDEAGYIASSVFESVLFKNTYYQMPEIGFKSTVEKITNQDIINFYKSNFKPAGTKIVVVGNISKEELDEQLNLKLCNWKNEQPTSLNFNYPSKEQKKYYVVNKSQSAQTEIRIGHISNKRNCKDYYAVKIMNTILGGQFSSRINLNLRENKGFTYGATSSFSYYNDAGSFEVHTAVDIKNTAAAVKEIFKELEGIRQSISTKEIEFAKSYLVKQYPLRFETYSQIAKIIDSMVAHSIPLDEIKAFENRIESVTEAEVITAAKENIFPDNCAVVLVGDSPIIKSQIEEQFNVTAVELDNEGNEVLVS